MTHRKFTGRGGGGEEIPGCPSALIPVPVRITTEQSAISNFRKEILIVCITLLNTRPTVKLKSFNLRAHTFPIGMGDPVKGRNLIFLL